MTGKELSTVKYTQIKQYARSEEIKTMFASFLGDREAEGYIYSVLIAVSQSEQLQQCSPESIMQSALRAATLGLSCDPSLGQAYLVPYGKEATLITGWRGIRDMALRTRQIACLNVDALYEGQEWEQDQLTGKAKITGTPESREAIGYFAYLKTFSQREHYLYMTLEEIDAHKRKYAKGYNRAQSAWKTELVKMSKKTVLSQLLKQWATLNPMSDLPVNYDNAPDFIDDMPAFEDVTIIEPEKKSNAEILDELGIDNSHEVERQKKNATSEQTQKPFLTIEDACSVKSSAGKPLVEYKTAQLEKLIDRLNDALDKPDLDNETILDYENKLEAAHVIIEARQDGSI